MHISEIYVDRFGPWSDLSLAGFTKGLNVVQANKGVPVAPLADFMRSVFFGFGDEIRRRHKSENVRVGGHLNLETVGGKSILRRQDGPEFPGRLKIENDEGRATGDLRLRKLLGDIDLVTFDCIFSLNFQRRRRICQLIACMTKQGIEFQSEILNLGETDKLNADHKSQAAELGTPCLSELKRERIELEVKLRNVDAHIRLLRKETELLHARRQVGSQEQQDTLEQELAMVYRQLRKIDHLNLIDQSLNAANLGMHNAKNRKASEVLIKANAILKALTCEELVSIEVKGGKEVFVQKECGVVTAWQKLDCAAQDQVYLAMSFASVDSLSRRGVELPVIFSGFSEKLSRDWLQATIAVVREYADKQQQVFVMVEDCEVARQFVLEGARVHKLETGPCLSDMVSETSELSCSYPFPESRLGKRGSEEDAGCTNAASWPKELISQISKRSTEVCPEQQETTFRWASRQGRPQWSACDSAPAAEGYRSSRYHLWESSPIEDSPSVDAVSAEQLRMLGIRHISDLLQKLPTEVEKKLSQLGISQSKLQQWRAESLLVCCVPHLRPYDARVLVSCEIDDPEQLSQLSGRELRERVEQFALTEEGQALLHSGTEEEVSRLLEWMRCASSQENSGEVATDQASEHVGTLSISSGVSLFKTKNQFVAPDDSEGNSSQEQAVRFAGELFAHASGWNYLRSTSDVVEAPSINQRTAERLKAVGIHTIQHLLDVNAVTAERKIDYQRIKTQNIKEWQAQAALRCRIPFLLDSHAQLLVACGITTVESLAAFNLSETWNRVEQFLPSSECRRILGSHQIPDLSDVRNWVLAAQNFESVKAA